MGLHLVIIPTYNEKENIREILDAIFSLPLPFHVLVIDDGSPDGTAGLVKEYQRNANGRLHLLERSGKLGLGTAYILGFKWALDKSYDFIYEMDADFSHNPADLIRLGKACEMEGADVAVGSRYIQGGQVKNWPFDRIAISYGASLYVRMVAWISIKDPTAGFVCYTRNTLLDIDLDKIHFIGYAFQIEMKYAALSLGFKVREIPITFIDREKGVSKMNMSIVKEAIWGVLQMKWQSFSHSYCRETSGEALRKSRI